MEAIVSVTPSKLNNFKPGSPFLNATYGSTIGAIFVFG